MALLDDVINVFSTNPLAGAIILAMGFLICHLLHAFRYAFFGFGNFFDKLKKFFKILFFLGSFT